ncbi:MAG: DUF6325 family protein [Acidimicrobiia bacterium]|nr:DUF6325 family protein [Acidimicrobiia bacterium]
MSDLTEMGPIDWMVIEFDRPFTGEAIGPLLDLVDRGLIRILDLAVLVKDEAGDVAFFEVSDLPGDEAAHMEVFVGVNTGILGEDDLAAAGGAIENGTRAVMLVYENAWAAPFATAVRRAGGQLVDHGRIPVQAIIAALDELDAADA